MFEIREKALNSHIIDLSPTDKNWEQWFLLCSDLHWDNPHCQRQLIEKHFNQAKERKAGILIFGDALCLMQGKYDPRRSKSSIRPEHNRADYLDVVIRDFAQYMKPWKDNIILISPGNHENGVRKNLETDPIERVVERMNTMPGSKVYKGGYGGWVRFQFQITKTTRQSKNLFYFHGSGGGGIVTKGIIQQQRTSAVIEGADICYQGHVHELMSSVWAKHYIDVSGKPQNREAVHLRGSTYKEEFADGAEGWHVERGAPPKPLGSWWVRFYKKNKNEVTFEWIPARA